MTNQTEFDILTPTNPVQTVAPEKEETNMSRATDKITALYCRLSQEDSLDGENNSNSNSNQKRILKAYAKEHHFLHPVFFVDNGYSGTNFDRPGFQAMLNEIEADRVSVVLTKDLSRLGRYSAMVGMFTNITFAQHNIRYITPYAAHELIRAIYIGAPDKSSGKRRQSIQICYDLVGFIPLDELMKQETA